MTPQLKEARHLLEAWVGPDLEPFCLARNEDGSRLWTLDQAHPRIIQWSVDVALIKCDLFQFGWELLERVVKPPAGLTFWLKASERRTSDVLHAFTLAIQRSKKETQ
jgi:hypothetical protein